MLMGGIGKLMERVKGKYCANRRMHRTREIGTEHYRGFGRHKL